MLQMSEPTVSAHMCDRLQCQSLCESLHSCVRVTDIGTHRIMEMLVLVCKSVVFSSEAGALTPTWKTLGKGNMNVKEAQKDSRGKVDPTSTCQTAWA